MFPNIERKRKHNLVDIFLSILTCRRVQQAKCRLTEERGSTMTRLFRIWDTLEPSMVT